jgi:hypothetical protein
LAEPLVPVLSFGQTESREAFRGRKSNTIPASERKSLTQLSDQCARCPLTFGKTQQALQFIDSTTNILNAIEVRL